MSTRSSRSRSRKVASGARALRLKQQSFLSQFSDDAKSGSGEDGSSISPSETARQLHAVAAAEAAAICRIGAMATEAALKAHERVAGKVVSQPYQFSAPIRSVPATRTAAAAARAAASGAAASRNLRMIKRQRRNVGAEATSNEVPVLAAAPPSAVSTNANPAAAGDAALWHARPTSADMMVGASRKGAWSQEEDVHILRCVQQGMSRWSSIAQHVSGRSGKQCRDRWFNFLEPNSRKGGWTEDEDRILETLVKQFQSQWSRIALRMPGRSESAVCNRWKTLRKLKHLEHCLGSSGDTAGLAKAAMAVSCDTSLMALSISLDDTDGSLAGSTGAGLGASFGTSGIAPMLWPLPDGETPTAREQKAQQTAAGLVQMGMLSPPFAKLAGSGGGGFAAAAAAAAETPADIFATGGVISMVPHARFASSAATGSVMGPPRSVPFTAGPSGWSKVAERQFEVYVDQEARRKAAARMDPHITEREKLIMRMAFAAGINQIAEPAIGGAAVAGLQQQQLTQQQPQRRKKKTSADGHSYDFDGTDEVRRRIFSARALSLFSVCSLSLSLRTFALQLAHRPSTLLLFTLQPFEGYLRRNHAATSPSSTSTAAVASAQTMSSTTIHLKGPSVAAVRSAAAAASASAAMQDDEGDMLEYSWGQLPVHDESGSWGPICTDVLDGDVDDMSLSLFNIAIDSGRRNAGSAHTNAADDVEEEIMGGPKRRKKKKKLSPRAVQLANLASLAKSGAISAAQKGLLKDELIRGAM